MRNLDVGGPTKMVNNFIGISRVPKFILDFMDTINPAVVTTDATKYPAFQLIGTAFILMNSDTSFENIVS